MIRPKDTKFFIILFTVPSSKKVIPHPYNLVKQKANTNLSTKIKEHVSSTKIMAKNTPPLFPLPYIYKEGGSFRCNKNL